MNTFEWTLELDKLFNEIETSVSKNAQLAIPYTSHCFYILVDASSICSGEVFSNYTY